MERTRAARQSTYASTQDAAAAAARSAEDMARVVADDASASDDHSQSGRRRRKKAESETQSEFGASGKPAEGEPVKYAFKPARVCLLIQAIPTPDKWLAGLGIPLFQPQRDEAVRKQAEEPEYKEAYLAQPGQPLPFSEGKVLVGAAGKAPPPGAAAKHVQATAANGKPEPLPGWVQVERPFDTQTKVNVSKSGGGSCLITDEQLVKQVNLSVGTLVFLDITGCKKVTPQTVLKIARENPHLKTIRASDGIGWTSSLVHQVVSTLPELDSLTTDLNCIKVDEALKQLLDHPLVNIRMLTFTARMELEEMQMLAEPLVKARIEIFNLANCRIGPKGFFALSTALERNRSITQLNLKKNDLGPMGGVRVGQMLRLNTKITSINVGVNDIRSDGCTEICRALCKDRGKNDRIHTLNLQCNGIDERAVPSIVEMLGDNETLNILDLSDNDLGPKGKKVCAALRTASVTQVFLAGNRMGDRAGKELLKTLRKNADIWKVTIYNNEFSNKLNEDLSKETLESLLDHDAADVAEKARKAALSSRLALIGAGHDDSGEEEEEGEDDDEDGDSDEG